MWIYNKTAVYDFKVQFEESETDEDDDNDVRVFH